MDEKRNQATGFPVADEFGAVFSTLSSPSVCCSVNVYDYGVLDNRFLTGTVTHNAHSAQRDMKFFYGHA